MEAGSWPNLDGNSNLVPAVANGLVFVAGNRRLRIFGLLSDKSEEPGPQDQNACRSISVYEVCRPAVRFHL